MKWLPSEDIKMVLTLSPEETIQKLQGIVEPIKYFRFFSKEKPFEGKVEGNTFDFKRIIFYRNSFLPQIQGKVVPHSYGSALEVKMSLHPLAMTFLGIWFFFLLAFWMVMIGAVITDGQDYKIALLPLPMILFGFLLMNLPFWYEVKKAKKLLKEVFGLSYREEYQINH